jgi:hypothetical protein
METAILISYAVGSVVGFFIGYDSKAKMAYKVAVLTTFKWLEENNYVKTRMVNGEKVFLPVVEKID